MCFPTKKIVKVGKLFFKKVEKNSRESFFQVETIPTL